MKSTTFLACWATWCCLIVLAATTAHGEAMLILNEFNAVDGDEFLKNDKSDTFFGRVQGNGDNWIELVVTGDHADIRGWQLRWLENDGDGNGTSVWDPTRVSNLQSQGVLTFANAAIWSDLRAGTIITISDKHTVNTEYEDTTKVTFDLSTDTSYNPAVDDWWIHVSSRQEAGSPSPLISSITNIDGDNPGAFSVGNKDWELRIFDGLATVFGPIGEKSAGWGGGGIGGDEVGKLEADPSPLVGPGSFKDGTSSTFGAPNLYGGGSTVQDFSTLRAVVPEPGSVALLVSMLLGMALWMSRRR